MIVKTIKKYKKGNGFRYEISINKKNIEELNNTKKVNILTNTEYKSFKSQIKSLKQTIDNQNKEIKKLYANIDNHKRYNKTDKESNDKLCQKIELLDIEHETLEKRNDKLIQENTELLRQTKYLKKELSNIDDLTNKFNTLIKDLNTQNNDKIAKLNQQHHDKLEQIYYNFNEDLKKYITVNQLQNTALKQILELGFIDLIRNKHKKIAKNQIKELDKKPILEYVLKGED
jgi:chromosome segregation ATPase